MTAVLALLALTVSTLLVVPVLGAAPPALAIFNGEDAADPVGAVQIVMNDTAFCTGTLINPAWVLTAKHCITDTNAQPATTKVRLGALVFGEGEAHDVLRIFDDGPDDSALLQLTERTDRLEMVLPYGYNDPSLGAPATIRGWGGTLGNPSRPASTLQIGQNIVASTLIGVPTMTLTSTDGSSTQSGDSGGPVVINGLVCGVHSRSSVLTSTAVKTSALVSWITRIASVRPGGACDLDTSKRKKAGLAQRIMAIGGAQTVGIDNNQIGYRNFLASMLTRSGLPSTFVGPDRAGPPPNDSVVDGVNNGRSPEYIQDLEKAATCAVYDYAPDIVTIVAGEEDIIITPTFYDAPARLNSMISTIQEVSPRTVVLVASIAPSPIPVYEPLVTQYNASVKKYVLDRANAGQHVAYVDTSDLVISYSPAVPVDGSGEKVIVELNPNGFLKEAAAFNMAIDNAVNAGWIPDSLPLNKEPCNATTSTKRDLRVMPLGSSTTYGSQSSHGNGYRNHFLDDVSQHVFSADASSMVDAVGSVRVGTAGDRDNEGWPGYEISAIAGKASCSVRVYQPNLITLLAGGNDVYNNHVEGAADRLAALIQQVSNDSPGAVVLVAGTQPYPDPTRNARSQTYNAAIPGVVDQAVARGVRAVYADTRALTVADIGPDGNHPTDLGYREIADAFLAAYKTAEAKGWLRPPNPQAADLASSPCGSTDGGAGTTDTSATDPVKDPRWEYHGVSFKEGFGEGRSYRWGDVNRDGKPEMFVVEPDQSWTFYWNSGRTDTGWTGWAKGVTRPAARAGMVGNQLRIADMDGDGRADCVTVDLYGNAKVAVWDSTKPPGQQICGKPLGVNTQVPGTGQITDAQILFPDVNGDGYDDYMLIQPRGTTRLWLNNWLSLKNIPAADRTAEDTFWDPVGQIQPGVGDPRIRRWADINGDGKADQIVLTLNGGARAWLNRGFSSAAGSDPDEPPKIGGVILQDIGQIASDKGIPTKEMQFVDVGGDGKADLVRTAWTGRTYIWLNRLNPPYTSQPLGG